MRKTAKFLSAAAALALAGCISVGGGGGGGGLLGGGEKKADTSIYTLPAGASMVADKRPGRGGTVVVVPKPQLPSGLETDRIALLFEKDHRLDYYADAKWSARFDDLLQDFVVSRAQSDLPGKFVGTPELTDAAKYRLALKFTDIQPVYADMPDKAPRLDAAVTVSVLNAPSNTVKTQFTVKKSMPASANNLTTITREMGELLQSVTDEALKKAAPFLG
jgi:ABC-type uncharacterized transport system auxiliary subunit